MDEFLLFEAFERGDYIPQQHIKKVISYVCGKLISWSPNCSYYRRQYNLATKLMLVCEWKKERSLPALEKRGETICGGELVNFYEDEKHQKCSCSMA